MGFFHQKKDPTVVGRSMSSWSNKAIIFEVVEDKAILGNYLFKKTPKPMEQ